MTIRHRKTTALATALWLAWSTQTPAQVATDGSLGPAGALAGPSYAITANLGRQVGTNLFHSFSTFNLANGQSATFSGPGGIANIVNRVTGGSASNIDGVLRSTIAGANLYLVNPSGILFGRSASLDLTGSFHASTANYVKLADGTRFDATTAGPSDSLLTSAPPAAFGFLGPAPAPIAVQGSNLSVPEGSSLSLVGGPVNLSDATLRTLAGDIRVVAMGGAGTVPLNATAVMLTGTTLAPVSIERSTLATESGAGAAPGRIVIRGGQITLLDSNITSTNRDAVDAPPIELAASGDLTVSASDVFSTAEVSGRGAALALSGQNVTIDRNAQVWADTWTDGPGGAIGIAATANVQVNAAQEDLNYTNVYTFAYGNGPAGSIRLTGDTVTVKSGNVFSGTGASGNSGSLVLQGREVSVIDGGFVYTYSAPGTSGNAGNVDMLASRRSLISGADWSGNRSSIFTQTSGTGRAGNVTIAAPEITMADGDVNSITYDRGDAGDLHLTGEVIKLASGASADVRVESGASNFTSGNGGNVEIRASRSVEINGSEFPGFARVAATTQASGRGGNIVVEAPSVLLDGGVLFSRTRFGVGEQGGIIVRSEDLRLQNGGGVISGSDGGDRSGSFILIEARSIFMDRASAISSSTTGSGDAGRVTINAQRVKLTDASTIQSVSRGSGSAGDLVLNIGESFEMSERRVVNYVDFFSGPQVLWPGGLLAQATGSGNAGRIFLRAPSVLLDDGRILSTALLSGQGGRVEIQADNLTMRNGAQVDTRSTAGSTGDAGSIDIAVSGRFEISGLSLVDGAFSGLYAQTQGNGRGGSIGVAADTLVVDRGLIRSSAGASGNAGTIRVRAGDVVLANGGWIDAGTSAGSSGAGGNIDLAASRSIVVRGIDHGDVIRPPFELPSPGVEPGTPGRAQGPFASTISSSTAGAGAGGDITLSASRIIVDNGARVSGNSSGAGAAGSIIMAASDALELSGGRISTEALTSDGGNITIRAGNLVYLKNSAITTSVGSGSGNGGNIFIDPTFVVLDGSRIAANAFGGAGGNINIIADYFITSPDSTVEASSQLGVSGSVQIAAPRTDPGSALARLPAVLFDASALLRASCAGRAGLRASSLVGVGRGGLAAAPDGFSISRYFADASAPLAQGGTAATFAQAHANALAARSVLLATCAN